MKTSKLFVLAAMLPCLVAPAAADEVDDAIAAFVQSDGFEPQDPDKVDEKLLSAFAATGAMRPDGAASALEKAVLLLETHEAALPRARYAVRYGQMVQEASLDTVPVSFVTVERYNLGPATRRELVDSLGEDNVDTPEAFGVGPHVAWRMVAMPLMGQTAAIMEVSRREIPEAAAASADCAGRPCLAPSVDPDAGFDWQEMDFEASMATAFAHQTPEGVATPARAVAELAVAAGFAEASGGEPHWYGIEQPEAARGAEPFLTVVVDAGLGQDTSVDAVLGQTLVNDDSIRELWLRRLEVPGQVYWLRSSVAR